MARSHFYWATIVKYKRGKPLINKKLKDQLPFGYYFPHPAEDYRVDGVNYVESELIFEDYVFKHLSNKK